MTVLLTGATGFVGANLLRALLKTEKDIHIFLRETSSPWRIKEILPQITIHTVDLTDREAVQKQVSKIKPKKIFHLATYGGYPDQEDFSKIALANFWGTANLLDACIKHDFEFFINTGSSSEYGIKQVAMSEDDVLVPASTYGVTKAAASLYCQSVAKKRGSKIFTLRLFSPYGYFEGSERLIPYVICHCLQNKQLELSNPGFVRDFVFIEDVVDAYIKVALASERLASGEIYNVGSGKQHTIKEVVDTIAALTGYCKPAGWGAKPARQADVAKMWEANITKIKTQTSWQPQHSLREGLSKTINWFENNTNQELAL
jgi:nucleoside-diphosphate-sugar epimerase